MSSEHDIFYVQINMSAHVRSRKAASRQSISLTRPQRVRGLGVLGSGGCVEMVSRMVGAACAKKLMFKQKSEGGGSEPDISVGGAVSSVAWR